MTEYQEPIYKLEPVGNGNWVVRFRGTGRYMPVVEAPSLQSATMALGELFRGMIMSGQKQAPMSPTAVDAELRQKLDEISKRSDREGSES